MSWHYRNGAEKEYGDRSSDADLHQMNSVHVPEMDCEGRFDSISTERQKFLGKWNDTPEANAVWKSFKAVLETLSRTKDSIGRATRVAMDCAKYGIAGEVIPCFITYASLLIVWINRVAVCDCDCKQSVFCVETYFPVNFSLIFLDVVVQ